MTEWKSLLRNPEVVDEINSQIGQAELKFDGSILDQIKALDGGRAVKQFGVDIWYKVPKGQAATSPFDLDTIEKYNVGIFKIKNINYQVTPSKQASAGLLCGPAVYGVLLAKDDKKLAAARAADPQFQLEKQLIKLIEKFFQPFVALFRSGDLKGACAIMRSQKRSVPFLRQMGYEDLANTLAAGKGKALISIFSDPALRARAYAHPGSLKKFGKTKYGRVGRVLNPKTGKMSAGNCIDERYVNEAVASGKYYKSKVIKPKYKSLAESRYYRSSTGSLDRTKKLLKPRLVNGRRVRPSATRRVCRPTKFGIAAWKPVQYGKSISKQSGKLALFKNAQKMGLGQQLQAKGEALYDDDAFRPANAMPFQDLEKYQLRVQKGGLGQYKVSRTGTYANTKRTPATYQKDVKGKRHLVAQGSVVHKKGAAYTGVNRQTGVSYANLPAISAGQSKQPKITQAQINALNQYYKSRDLQAPAYISSATASVPKKPAARSTKAKLA